MYVAGSQAELDRHNARCLVGLMSQVNYRGRTNIAHLTPS